MAPEDECEREMFVTIRWEKRKFSLPLSQLEGIKICGRNQRGYRRLALLGGHGIRVLSGHIVNNVMERCMELSKNEQRFRRKILSDEEVRAFAKAAKELLGPEIMAISTCQHLSMEDSLRYMSLSARLEDVRTARGLTLKDAAKELGTSKYRLEEVEKGRLKSLNPDLLVQYVEYLGLKAWLGKWEKANPALADRLGLAAGANKATGEKRASIPVFFKTLAEKKIKAFLEKRLPLRARDQIRLSHRFRGNTVTIFEHRAPWMKGDTKWSVMSAAQLRYYAKSGTWKLYCADRNSRWHEYANVAPTKDLDGLLTEIDRDPTGIFWG